MLSRIRFGGAAGLVAALTPVTAWAQEAAAIDTGDTAWILTATALVLFMKKSFVNLSM